MKRLFAQWTPALIAFGAFFSGSRPVEERGEGPVGLLRALWGVPLVLGVQAKKLAVPGTTIEYFEHLPRNLHYFNDTRVRLSSFLGPNSLFIYVFSYIRFRFFFLN